MKSSTGYTPRWKLGIQSVRILQGSLAAYSIVLIEYSNCGFYKLMTLHNIPSSQAYKFRDQFGRTCMHVNKNHSCLLCRVSGRQLPFNDNLCNLDLSFSIDIARLLFVLLLRVQVDSISSEWIHMLPHGQLNNRDGVVRLVG